MDGSRAIPFNSPTAASNKSSFGHSPKNSQDMSSQPSIDPLLQPPPDQATRSLNIADSTAVLSPITQPSDAGTSLAQGVSYIQDCESGPPGFLNVAASDASSGMQNPDLNVGRMIPASDLAVSSPVYAFTYQLPEANDDSIAFPQLNSHTIVPNSSAASAEDDRREVSSTAIKGKKLRLPEKARMQCTNCQKRFQPPKRTDTTLCSQCRKSETPQTALLASAGTAGFDADSNIPLPAELARVASGKNWDASISSANDETTQLLNKPHHSVSASDDDFEEIDDDTIVVYSEELFAALLQPPTKPPSDLDDGKKEKHCTSQLDAYAYAACAKLMDTEDEVGDASARCRLAIEETITLHRDGIRVNELTKEFLVSIQKTQAEAKKKGCASPKPKTRTGIYMDVDILCTQRIEMMITAVSQNKLVALELLDGRKVSDLVRCPTHFFERKRVNFKSNMGKYDDQKVGGDLRRKKEGAEAAFQGQTQAQAGSKRMAGDLEGDESQAQKKTREELYTTGGVSPMFEGVAANGPGIVYGGGTSHGLEGGGNAAHAQTMSSLGGSMTNAVNETWSGNGIASRLPAGETLMAQQQAHLSEERQEMGADYSSDSD